MTFKEKLAGIVLVALGLLPLLLKVESISKSVSTNSWISYIVPGTIFYQIIIIAVGILLVITIRKKKSAPRF